MPIVQHEVEQTAQTDGGANIVVRLFDQDAREYVTQFRVPAGFDVNGKVQMMIAEMNEQLAASEFQQFLG